MYTVPPAKTPVRVFNTANASWDFPDLDSALLALAKTNAWPANRRASHIRWHVQNALDENIFRLVDAWNEPIDRPTARAALMRLFPIKNRGRAITATAFRGGPVPHTGHHGHGGFYRAPHTRQELATHGAFADELAEIGLDEARTGRLRDLPTAWDDIARCRERGWKTSRSTRWRAKA
jgi:hypothetical protein